MRPELQEFISAMNKKLYQKDKEYGDSWKECDIDFLAQKLQEEISEWNMSYDDILQKGNKNELIDIANMCLFLYIRIKRMEE